MDPFLTLIGRLANDPSQSVTANGLKVTRFRLASGGRRPDRAGGGWVDVDPLFMTVICWRQLGDNVMQSLSKGDAVVVRGRLTYREWDDAGGGRQSRYEMQATTVGPDLARYVVTLSRPLRELPDLPALPAQPGQPEGEPQRDASAA
jgi:single-strand DNA-binding protein